MTDDPEFFMWLDGELDPQAAAAMAAKVAADPALAAMANKHRALSARLRAAFDPIAAEPVPDAVAVAGAVAGAGEGAGAGAGEGAGEGAGQNAEVIDFAAARDRRFSRTSWGLQAAAMAASLAIGLVVGGNLLATGGPVVADHGQLVASKTLGDALDVRLASAPAGEGTRIGLTFRDHSGHYCRSFTDGSASGLACRSDGQWRIRGLFQASEGQSDNYRMAAGPNPQLMALIDDAMAGAPLDAAGERTVVKAGWK